MAHTMSARSEVSQELKQITERSMDLMRVIRSVSQGEGGAETADSVMKLLIHTDAALQEAVVKLRQNQEIQGHIEHVQGRIASREANVRDLALQLRTAESILQGALEETAPCVLAIKQAQQTHGLVSVHDLIDYASKVALTSGKIPGANPWEPFPNAELFPRTRLFKTLIPTRAETMATEGVVEPQGTYQTFLGDLGGTDAADETEEDLADF